VRLNDSYLRSIAYIGVARPGTDRGIDTHGTGFLLAHEETVYLVTAAHVAVDFVDGPMDIRLNKQEGGLGGIEHFDETNWYFHPNTKVDVAVMPIEVPRWARAESLKSKWIASEFKVTTKDFGSGDLAYIVGIFNKMRGKEKNEPFVHTGHIASMGYGETALIRDWSIGAKKSAYVEVNGYFVQATTLPESSGSPVFVRRSIETTVGTPRTWAYGSVWFLGLWSGSWETTEKNVIVGDDMGMCVPAPRILEVLELPELKNTRIAAKVAEEDYVAMKPQKRSMAGGDTLLRTMLNAPSKPLTKKKAANRKARG
jgi:hypothetical protein